MKIFLLVKAFHLSPPKIKHINLCRFLIYLLVLWTVTACSERRSNWEGIWQAEAEEMPGFRTLAEFEFRHAFLSDKWSGSWKQLELMSIGEFEQVVVSDSSIDISFGLNTRMEGILSKDKTSFKGVFYAADSVVDTLLFTRVNNWTEVPVRMGEDGQPVEHWNYKAPDEINDGWTVATLRDVGIAQQPLKELFQSVIDGKYQGLDAVLIAYQGQLVLEEYFHFGKPDRVHSLQSVTKSLTSLLYGIAYDEGILNNLEVPVHNFFPEYSDSSQASTWSASLRHTLMMSAGLEWNEMDIPYSDLSNDAVQMNISNDMFDYVLSKDKKAGVHPGEKFYYNSGLSILLGGVLKSATGMTADHYAEKTLFRELGIHDYQWGSLNGKLHTGGGLYLRARDLLKTGQLVLDKGKWKAEQVISKSWIEESTAHHLKVESPQDTLGYGYQWWRKEFKVKDKSYQAIYASGYGGQFLWVVPELDLVVVALHHIPQDQEDTQMFYWNEMEKIIIPAIL
jgi:CubicO group peptidase (beta-lactamase class C family)